MESRQPPIDNETAPPDAEIRQPEAAAYSEASGDPVADAAEVDDMQDTVEDLDLAIAACADLSEFIAATNDHPDVLDGADADTFAMNRCLYSEDAAVQASAICAHLDS
jgi:hypothetical protein